MLVCAKCGRESEGEFAFCPYCAAPLTAAPATREQRKVVTVVFCDVTGSTALGESTDPEALRALLARYFERMEGIIESHGGTVEKFIGDAVMAVFGVPQVHEDDALRACRAAVEMRDALPELGVEARIGVNTGEVVTGTAERLATGDAVNVAARLEQAAHPGEILIGETTLELVRGAVETESVEPPELKGKTEPVPAFRLLGVWEAPERRHDAPFVGRSRELALVCEAWERVRRERCCELVTVVGDAGVGKSRLISEFLAIVEARVVTGRCLPYGEGITYWPIVEAVKQLGALPSDDAAAAAIQSVLGETDAATTTEEIAWAFRKLLEEQARQRPLVCVFDDIQWGEETFLDLVEHVALLASEAPMLLLCMARSELLDRRSSWPVTLPLEPLEAAAVDALIGGRVGERQREQVVRASGGNPLFVAELLAMRKASDGELAVPPTLQALLAARLDQLEPSERRVLECAAIEGEIFHRGAVQALAPAEAQVTSRLAALVRRELIRTNRAQIPGDDGFRFRHLLIRDAAYASLPKAARAEMHERFADWLGTHKADIVELDELVGYHLEQAARCNRELGKPDRHVAERAADRLAAAGRRALARADETTASSLLERALSLTRPIRFDVQLELDLSWSYRLSAPVQAAGAAEAVVERLAETDDKAAVALARVLAGGAHCFVADDPDIEGLEALAREALPLLEATRDDVGLARVWWTLAYRVANTRCHYAEMAHAAIQALNHARLAGQNPRHLFELGLALVLGPEPADEALRMLDALSPDNPDPSVLLERAELLAMLGHSNEASVLAREANARYREVAGTELGSMFEADVARFDDDYEGAARHLSRLCNWCEEHGQRSYLSTYAPLLGRSLCVLGCHDEAEPLAKLGRELGDEQDVMTQMIWRQVQALVLTNRGEHREAEHLAGKAVAIGEATDALNLQGDAYCDLAEVLAAAGRTDEAAQTLEQALERYERKKNLAMVAQVRPRLEELRAGVTRAP